PAPPLEAATDQIISLQSPAASQSNLLWRDPCITGTLAGNYRVGDYNVDYSVQDPHPADQNHQQHGYDLSSHHRGPLSHGTGLPDPAGAHHGHHGHHHPSMPQHHQQHHAHQLLMDAAHMSHARSLGAPQFGAAGPSIAPLYPSVATASPVHGHAPVKRPRPDDLDIGGLDQSGMDSMQQSPLAAAYSQAAASHHMQHPTHHHHRLPDTGPPSKLLRREGEGGGGGAPNVVGQAGMPLPAPRPKGPKLKFTPEDDQLLIDLKENKNLTWKQIADFFPGRSSGTLQVRYCTKLKAKTTQWTEETDQKLRTAIQDYESEKWRIVANKVGSGFTPAACRERYDELAGVAL
ncbi:MYB DNA-binding domain-containing protein, partial [Plectosphaerella plurivora]